MERLGPSDAAVTVVLVPGVGTDLDDRRALRSEADRVRATVAAVHDRDVGGQDVAVVSWLGYDPPDHFLGGLHAGAAATGAPRLVDDVARLRAAGADRVVVVGHSYGALVAARAGALGLAADELVLIGAPGLGVEGVDEIHLRDDGRVWVAAAAGDLVALLARTGMLHGPDPVGIAPRLPTSLRGHGGYLEDPVLLAALGAIAVGADPVISPGSRRPGTVSP